MWTLLLVVLCQDSAYKDLKVGDRVEVTFASGHTLRGELSDHKVTWKKDSKTGSYAAEVVTLADVQKDDSISLRLDTEYVRLTGIVSFKKNAITKIQKLAPLTANEKAKRLEEKIKAYQNLEKEEADRLNAQLKRFREDDFASAQKEGPKEDTSATDAQVEKDKKARELYKEFPESEGWGQAKYDELKKYLTPTGKDNPEYIDFRKNRAAADPREVKFLKNYELWAYGKNLPPEEDKSKAVKVEVETEKAQDPPNMNEDEKAAVDGYRKYLSALFAQKFEEKALEETMTPGLFMTYKKTVGWKLGTLPKPQVTQVAVYHEDQGTNAQLTVQGLGHVGKVVMLLQEKQWRVESEQWQ